MFPGTTGKKSEESGPLFSFGAVKTESGTPSSGFAFGPPSSTTSFAFTPPAVKKEEAKPTTAVGGFGDAFKPKVGSWECSVCLIRNNSDKLYCASCDTPKDDTVPKKEASKGKN